MSKHWKGWQIVLLTVVLTVIGNIIAARVNSGANRLDNSASIEYVDKQDEKLKKEIDKKVDKDSFEIVKDDIKFIKNWIINKE